MNEEEERILHTSMKQVTQLLGAAPPAQFGMSLVSDESPVNDDITAGLNEKLANITKVPSVQSITTLPENPTSDVVQLVQDVQTLDSYCAVLVAYCVNNEHPEPYDVANPAEASAFARAMAKWRNYVMTGGAVRSIAAYLPVTSINAQSMSQETSNASVHSDLLGALFKGFAFPSQAMKELDSILTNTFKTLKDAGVSTSKETRTFDNFLSFYYLAQVPGTGGEGQPPAVYIARLRVFYLHIDQATWEACIKIGKSHASVRKFAFHMNYYDMDTTMNSALVRQDMAAINDGIQKLCSKSTVEINAMMNMKAITADPVK